MQTVKGRLKENFNFWQNTLEVNDFVLETTKDGVKLPFIKTPLKAEFKNNVSALDNKEFVDSALKELMSKCVIEVESKPHVISSLSVSTNSSGKKRLILDLRYVNKHLWKQSVKFEDWKVFQNYAPFIFTKAVRPLVKHWRSSGIKIVVFIDDGQD